MGRGKGRGRGERQRVACVTLLRVRGSALLISRAGFLPRPCGSAAAVRYLCAVLGGSHGATAGLGSLDQTDEARQADGKHGCRTDDWDMENFAYWDDASGKALEPETLQKARRLEIEHVPLEA